jgi:uncharacterized SAM-binding protein YcdF (DUF218 family)
MSTISNYWYFLPLSLLILFFVAYYFNRTWLLTGFLLSCSIAFTLGIFFFQAQSGNDRMLKALSVIPLAIVVFFLLFGVFLIIAFLFYNKQKNKKKRKPPKLILCGGKGNDELCSESVAMWQYAKRKGIPDEDMLLESKSVSTFENMMFSKRIMDSESGGKPYRCIYATSNYHLLRAGILARKAGLKISGIGAKTALYYLPNAILREYIAYIRIHLKLNIIIGICSFFFGSLAFSAFVEWYGDFQWL